MSEKTGGTMSHTPGVWEIETTHPYEKDPAEGRVAMSIRSKEWSRSDLMADYRGNIICSFVDSHGGRFHAFDETNANALLIAAAPDLLDACEAAAITLNINKDRVTCPPLVEKLRKAIDKAKGRDREAWAAAQEDIL